MNMKKWIIAAVACSALALGACGGQNKNSSAANPDKVYRVGMNAEFAPFESQTSEGNVEGFDVDLMNAMAKAGNFKVEFKHQPWESLFPSLGNGDIDIVISGVTITDERKQSMDFSDPYFEITQVVLVPKGKKVASSDDLKNMAKVGVVTGQTGDTWAYRDILKSWEARWFAPLRQALYSGRLKSLTIVTDGENGGSLRIRPHSKRAFWKRKRKFNGIW